MSENLIQGFVEFNFVIELNTLKKLPSCLSKPMMYIAENIISKEILSKEPLVLSEIKEENMICLHNVSKTTLTLAFQYDIRGEMSAIGNQASIVQAILDKLNCASTKKIKCPTLNHS